MQEGNTAIHLAAKFGHIGELAVFRDFGLNLAHTSAKTGLNALHVASIHGQTQFAQEILHHVSIKHDVSRGTNRISCTICGESWDEQFFQKKNTFTAFTNIF